jgi:cell division initiation protein
MEESRFSISPAEIKGRQFGKKMRGYDPEEVDDVLKLAAESLEQALVRIDKLASDLEHLGKRIDQFEKMETTIKETLVTTQVSVEEIKKNAEKEAELTKREAQVEAATEMEMHQRKVEEIKVQIERLKNLRDDYLISLRSLVGSHQEMLDNMVNEYGSSDSGLEKTMDQEHEGVRNDI